MAESNIEKNRFLATEVMGRCWHDWCHRAPFKPESPYSCLKEGCDEWSYTPHNINPDYLTNLSDRQDLLEACVEKEWWGAFLDQHSLQMWDKVLSAEEIALLYKIVTHEKNQKLPIELFIQREALARAIYKYLKERDNEKD